MAKRKRRRPQHLLAFLLTFGLLLGMLPGGIAEAGAVEADASPKSLALEGGAATVVYLDGTSGEDTNSGADKDHAVKTLDKAYELATAGDIKTDPSANAVILVCGQTSFTGANFNIPASEVKEKAVWSHVGTLTLTSKYGNEDYTGTAAMSIAKTSSDRFMQMGGPTVFDNMTWDLSGSSAMVLFYVGTSFKVTESTLVLKGGDTPQFLSAYSGSVTTATLVLSGVTGEFALPEGSWTKLVVKDSSDVEMLDKLAADLTLEVEAGSKITLAAEDTHEHTGEGQVIPYPHVWVEEPGKKWSLHAALMAQSILSAVIARRRERRPCLWPNTVCQTGYAASAAAETTRST